MSDVAVLERSEEALAPVVVESKPPKAGKQKDLTPEEEQVLATQFAMCEKGQRFLLLRAFEGNAHKAYNKRVKGGSGKVGSFEEYAQNVLGLTHDASYLSRLVSAAKVERAITGESFNALKLSPGEGEVSPVSFKPRLTVKAAEQIAQLPEDKWQSVYEEAVGVPGEHTPKEVAENLRKITAREYKALHPDAPKKEKKQGRRKAEEPIVTSTAGVVGLTDAPKRTVAPVKAATYDGSEEQKFLENGGTAAEWAEQQGVGSEPVPVTEGVAPTPDAYEVLQDENRVLRSFLKAFLAAMETPAEGQPEVALMTLYNDATEWAKAHRL